MREEGYPAGPAAAHLAGRFAADAQALRRRAEQLGTTRGASPAGAAGTKAAGKGAPKGAVARPPAGPDAAACARMADACERVSTLFAGARDVASLGALVPLLEQTLADERTPEARHVYAGALSSVRDLLGEADDDEEDDDDEEGDDVDD